MNQTKFSTMRTIIPLTLLLFVGQLSLAQKNDVSRSDEAIADFIKTDPDIKAIIDSAYAYAVLPSVGKGAVGIGGASGNGTLYKQGAAVADVNMTQVTIGFQFGGQAYTEIVFFEDSSAYGRFVEKDFEFAAQASAVALSSGVSANAAYKDGVLIFTRAKGGLMYEASVGGQRFKVRMY